MGLAFATIVPAKKIDVQICSSFSFMALPTSVHKVLPGASENAAGRNVLVDLRSVPFAKDRASSRDQPNKLRGFQALKLPLRAAMLADSMSYFESL